jgi:glyoxylase-like metal-dependent hydrolase (beta-lactamase superfamily II)
MKVETFFDQSTSTFTHLVWDAVSKRAAIIDPVLDYDPKSGHTGTSNADRLIDRVRQLQLEIDWLLETHVHADHLSSAPFLQKALGGQIVIGSGITAVQKTFAALFNADRSFARDGSQFDRLVKDGEQFAIGALKVTVLHTPGHTPACVTYVVEDSREEPVRLAAFVGDTIFMPDYGTARCDFPGGDARTLYRSIRKLLSLPAETTIHLCHDYPPAGREVSSVTTVGEELARNIHVHSGIDEQAFVQMREARDATLSMPVLLLPAVQINMRAGQLPPPENNGIRYLKIPLDFPFGAQ